MKVQELVEMLYEYNPDADIFVCAHNKHIPFTLSYGSSEGVTKETADVVSFYVDELNNGESEG